MLSQSGQDMVIFIHDDLFRWFLCFTLFSCSLLTPKTSISPEDGVARKCHVLLVEDHLVSCSRRYVLDQLLFFMFLVFHWSFYKFVCIYQLNQKFALALLAKLGHSVRLAVNGAEAVRFYKESLTVAGNAATTTSPLTRCVSLPVAVSDFVTEISNCTVGIETISTKKGDTVPQSRLSLSPLQAPLKFDICLMDISMPVWCVGLFWCPCLF